MSKVFKYILLFLVVIVIFVVVTNRVDTLMGLLQKKIFISPIIHEKIENKYTTLDLSYPQYSEKKYSELFKFISESKASFLNDYGSTTEEEAKKLDLGGDRKYEYMMVTRIATSTRTVSYIMEIYTFTGGAHGSTIVNSFTYDINGKYVTLDDVLVSPYLENIAKYAREYLYDKLEGESQKENIDSGTEPNKENYSTWYITEENLVFVFGQYSIGPYVLGIVEFPLSKKLIDDKLKKEFK